MIRNPTPRQMAISTLYSLGKDRAYEMVEKEGYKTEHDLYNALVEEFRQSKLVEQYNIYPQIVCAQASKVASRIAEVCELDGQGMTP